MVDEMRRAMRLPLAERPGEANLKEKDGYNHEQ